MSLSSLGLDAFFEVARTGNFSVAAKALSVTQSALSQRIKNLETDLRTALFIRDKTGARLTESGEKLLRYCRLRESMEAQVLHDVAQAKPGDSLVGSLRVAGFSTVLRSLVLPSLSPLVQANPGVSVELMSRELRDIPGLLRTGACDLALTDDELSLTGVKSVRVGFEENVLIEPATGGGDGYLDHDSHDRTTMKYLRSQGQEISGRRLYLDEIYGILDGVALGWGRAVVPKHLLEGRPGIRQVAGMKPLRTPVYLSHYDSPLTPSLIKLAVEALRTGLSERL